MPTAPGQGQQRQQQCPHGPATAALALLVELEVDDDGVVVGGAERVVRLDQIAGEGAAIFEQVALERVDVPVGDRDHPLGQRRVGEGVIQGAELGLVAVGDGLLLIELEVHVD